MSDKKKNQDRQQNKKQETKKNAEIVDKQGNLEEHKGRGKTIGIICGVIVVLALVATGLWLLSGEGRKPSDTLVFTVGEEAVYLDEINFCILQNVLKYGVTTDVLNNASSKQGMSADEYYKQEFLEMITDYKVEYIIAKQRGITISEEEEQSIRNSAVEFMGSVNGRVLSQLGISQDMLIEVYRQRQLAQKLEDSVAEDIETEEQNFCTMYMLVFPKIEMEEDGETPIMLSEEELDKRKHDVDAAYQELMDGAEIELVAEKYGVTAYSGETSNLSGSFDEPFSQYAESLKEGEYSPILDLDGCYAILKMITYNNEEMVEQIMGYYKADLVQNRIAQEKIQWYENLGIEEPELKGNVWDNITLYDFTQYVED